MSELKVYVEFEDFAPYYDTPPELYDKSEADKVIAEKDAEIAELKNRIAPKRSDKTLQERLNEVCKKHAVSTLQDLDWAFCESEKGRARDFIEAVKAINHHKRKRCVAMARWCEAEANKCLTQQGALICFPETDRFQYLQWHFTHFSRWHRRWLELAKTFKEGK